MAQVSTPPDRMMHRFFLDFEEGFSSPPVRSWMAEREDSKMDRNWSTFDGLMFVLLVAEAVMVCDGYCSRKDRRSQDPKSLVTKHVL